MMVAVVVCVCVSALVSMHVVVSVIRLLQDEFDLSLFSLFMCVWSLALLFEYSFPLCPTAYVLFCLSVCVCGGATSSSTFFPLLSLPSLSRVTYDLEL